jgi:hypothetical protein
VWEVEMINGFEAPIGPAEGRSIVDARNYGSPG